MTVQSVFSIVLFVVVYLVLLVAALGITGLSLFGAFTIIVAKPMLLTIALGIGLASLGFFILVFLFKFLFKKHKMDRSHLTEITEEQEPKLFQFIREIVNEVDTDFPQKIYLSNDVNASVFYNSSFWSMFFPIRKNLQIGLGLVNSVSEQEFKAILAHEFGHFSQRSMKVGSYVYNVNQVIFNLIYENESFDRMIQKWANMSGYFSIFVAFAVKIIEGIQWILRKMYDFINISYLGLSREMEFHADEVAAHVAGYLPLKESLLRLDLAQHSYNDVLNFYGNRIAENIKSRNIYQDQTFVMQFIAAENKIPLQHDLPLVTTNDLNKFNKSKLNIKDQWASHPSTDERILALEKLNISKTSPKNGPAKALFMHTQTTEELATARVFETIVYEGEVEVLDQEKFKAVYTEFYFKNSFPKLFNGYYDDKNPMQPEDVETVVNNEISSLEELFSAEQVDTLYDVIALAQDIDTISHIAEGVFPIKTFDYDGKKYTKKEAKDLVERLKLELEVVKEEVRKNDRNIYHFFQNQCLTKGTLNTFHQHYEEFAKVELEHEQKIALFNEIAEATSFISRQTAFEEIESNFKKIAVIETKIKSEIRLLLENEKIAHEINVKTRQNFENYLSVDFVYFGNGAYYDDNLQILFGAINDYNYLISRIYFFTKQELLVFKASQV